MHLVIVESPTKAKTISKFLGKDYAVKSSYGHVRDLPKSKMGIDIKNNFKPEYIIPDKAKERVDELKKISRKSNEIILATDEDREGEAIAWHLISALELKKLKSKKIKRIVFHEITKNALEKALKNTREVDINLVNAQQARRILDRLVGYELSPFLWKKIRRGLSAGRVQSIALRFIAEREREIEKFNKEEYWTISAQFKKENTEDKNGFEAGLIKKNDDKIEEVITLKLFAGNYKTKKTIIADKKSADHIATELKNARYKIKDIAKREIKRTPPPPFTTSTLQQTAISALGFSSKQTMMIAQKLYEKGFITYMRTDSLNMSIESMLSAKKIIGKLFGEEYALENPRFFKTKSKGAQEAHEAIRPSRPEKTPDELRKSLDPKQYKLYKLIWSRMIACQMQPAILNSVKVIIKAVPKKSKNNYSLQANGSTVKFDGFLKVYGAKYSTKEKLLPSLEIDELLKLISLNPEKKFTSPPPRYSEAALVKALEEHGIGRPSTYAPTISTIIEREYVKKNEDRKLYPLEIGLLVNDLLVKHFADIVNPEFTAEMENDMDKIAVKKKEWTSVIGNFYKPFHENLVKKTEKVKKEDLVEKVGRKCKKCGGDLVVKFGRFGKFIACSNFPECKYTEKTEADKKVEKENKGVKCEKCGADMMVKYGKFGAFLGCSNYPKCKNIQRIENKIGIKCPKCGKGEIVEKKTKKGRIFYACNRWPECDFALWQKPTGEKCPRCQSPLVFAAKEKIKCSNKGCGFEKNIN